MLYLLDTADCKSIAAAWDIFPLHGVTTNPTIAAKEKREFLPLLQEIRSIIGNDAALHAQAMGTDVADFVRDAEYLRAKIDGELFVKVPVTPQGLKAISVLKKDGLKITATAVYTAQQALLAARAGADFVAPYVNRIDNTGSNGILVVEDILQTFFNYQISCQVLGASFKNVLQINELAKIGCPAATMHPDILWAALAHPLTDSSVATFNSDWLSVYDGLTVQGARK